MKFAITTLYTKNLEKTVEFYTTFLDMPVIDRRAVAQEKELVFLGQKGDVILELVETDEDISYSGFSLGFEVDDLDSLKEKLKKNGYHMHLEMPAGESSFLCFFKGPNGEEIELISK